MTDRADPDTFSDAVADAGMAANADMNGCVHGGCVHVGGVHERIVEDAEPEAKQAEQ